MSQFVVRNSQGKIDTQETIEKFRVELSQFALQLESEEALIAQAVDAVLESNVGTRTNLDFVTSSVARSLNATAQNYNEFKNKTADYIRANACGEKNGQAICLKTGDVLVTPRKYFLGKGRDGGVARWSDRIVFRASKNVKA